ncbi:MAG: aminopeptidase P family protein [Ignavibacteriales bacterium]|nr:aminopeptidase P family protein [Ignavibacteriales bacterium]
MEKELVLEKVNQAAHVLNELDIDVWMTFVRESSINHDPCMDLVVGTNCTWQSAFLINRNGDSTAIVGSLEAPHMESVGTYRNVIGYVQSAQEPLLKYLEEFNPKKIAVNYSTNANLADGLTHGMYLTLLNYLDGTPYPSRFVSSERIVSMLRGRKSRKEVEFMKIAIRHTLEIYDMVTAFIKPGKSEKEIAGLITGEIKRRGLEEAWELEHCPSVFTGPETAGAHSGPTDRQVEKGHVVNIDFGVKFNGYCSDLQRSWYILRDGEDSAPAEVQRGYDVIQEAITRASKRALPGVQGCEVDDEARNYIVECGYAEYQHGLGHQVGRIVHDGGVGFYPRWERYNNLPYLSIEKGQVFTLEPRLLVPGHGIVTIEEMIQIGDKKVEWLSERQPQLFLIRE